MCSSDLLEAAAGRDHWDYAQFVLAAGGGFKGGCIVGATEIGAPAQYELSATPALYGRTGRLSFFRDARGKYHAADHQGAVGHSLDPGVD